MKTTTRQLSMCVCVWPLLRCQPFQLATSVRQPRAVTKLALTHCVSVSDQQQEAIQRALEENPELAAQLDANYLNKVRPHTPVLC